LQDWVLPVDWLEYGSEEIELSPKHPWWGRKGNVRGGRTACRRVIHGWVEGGVGLQQINSVTLTLQIPESRQLP
jgi:hypothetical protein